MKDQEMVREGWNESGPSCSSFLEYGEENANQNGELIGNESAYNNINPNPEKWRKALCNLSVYKDLFHP